MRRLKRITALAAALILLFCFCSCSEDGENADPAETEGKKPKTARVAITFDDGPSRQGLTEKIVDEFCKYDGKATFFVIGNLISGSTGEAMAYAAERGFEYGVHGFTHEIYFDNCEEEAFLGEVRRTKEAIERYTGKPVTLLRAPGGRITQKRADLIDMPVINWSVDSEDWRYKGCSTDEIAEKNIQTIVDNVVNSVEDGDIVLMHEIYQNSYEATCRILRELDARGFAFVTVTELIGEDELFGGETYYCVP